MKAGEQPSTRSSPERRGAPPLHGLHAWLHYTPQARLHAPFGLLHVPTLATLAPPAGYTALVKNSAAARDSVVVKHCEVCAAADAGCRAVVGRVDGPIVPA